MRILNSCSVSLRATPSLLLNSSKAFLLYIPINTITNYVGILSQHFMENSSQKTQKIAISSSIEALYIQGFILLGVIMYFF